MMDAFGNPLGTTYQQNPDGSFILDAEGAPIVDIMGTGVILTDGSGEATIRILRPANMVFRLFRPRAAAGYRRRQLKEQRLLMHG